MRGVPLTERSDQPIRVVLTREAQAHQHDHAGPPDAPDRLDGLIGVAGLSEHLHIRSVVDQEPGTGSDDGERVDEDHSQSAW